MPTKFNDDKLTQIKQQIHQLIFSYLTPTLKEWDAANVIITSNDCQVKTSKTIITTPHALALSWLFTQLRDNIILPELIQENEFYRKLALAAQAYQYSEADDENPQRLLLSVLEKAEKMLNEYHVEVFVYGTLMAGESNHRLMNSAEFLGEDAIENAQLVNLGSHPMLVPGAGVVYGECYRIPLKMVQVLDRLEGHPHYYRRRWVDLKRGHQALVYEGNEAWAKGCPPIPSGRWQSALASSQSQRDKKETFVTSSTYEFLSYLRSLDVKVFAEGEQLRCSVPKGVLTPTLQAELVERKLEILTFLRLANAAASSNLSPIGIQPAGSRRPFFCVHPAGGNVICYVDLAHHLGLDQPFYGLQASGLDWEQQPCTQLEKMASHYIEALRTVQPQGPYLLGGWSMGGIVAFEMAQQLQKQGQKVALVALLDAIATASNVEPVEEDNVPLLASFAQDLGLSLETLNLSLEQFMQLDTDEKLAFIFEQARKANLLSPNVELSQVRRLFHVFRTNIRAMWSYVPQAYLGRVTLFKSREQFAEDPQDPTMGWGKLATEGVEIHVVPGNHYTMIGKPHVQVLAERLRACLDEAQAVN